jgi:hypothetical protein
LTSVRVWLRRFIGYLLVERESQQPGILAEIDTSQAPIA